MFAILLTVSGRFLVRVVTEYSKRMFLNTHDSNLGAAVASYSSE